MIKAVVTTIQKPTPAIESLAARLRGLGELVIVGDKKGPFAYEVEGVRFLPLDRQLQSEFTLAQKLPVGHYARKNVGYLDAIARGATCLYETDDDNAPLDSWALREPVVAARPVRQQGWLNVYRCFSDELVWPRGLPLDSIAASNGEIALAADFAQVRAPIQQGLANGSPDVDAVWRLVMDRPLDFEAGRPSVQLPPGCWCPFNSQSTWWWPEAFPLLYLPSYCSFRMTDIWRSFVAQRCLWELGLGLVFHAAEVVQERNEHDLMRDFNDEVPGYQRNRELARVLEATALQPGEAAVAANLRRCYEVLVEAGFFDRAELELVDAWCADLSRMGR